MAVTVGEEPGTSYVKYCEVLALVPVAPPALPTTSVTADVPLPSTLGGEAHLTRRALTNVAGLVRCSSRSPKMQARLAAPCVGEKPLPTTEITVPPRTGPDGGSSRSTMARALAFSSVTITFCCGEKLEPSVETASATVIDGPVQRGEVHARA
jgi:hypothetical protein